ncbi:ATP synthase F1 subunit epsilon [Clostridium sp. Marseille-P299]|uniref:ATP synthase F1 subunit epsilon n=1 Tax=Clostridium sp. Marseille-P299 TaxID=1805477 RepID=UPI0008363F7E|nr:ATP synthase F1 subunit epsilon [Clostridium sp. Marseille-P299]
MADNSKMFQVQVISPDRIFYEGDVDMIEVRTSEGDMGIYKNHIPLTAILVPGILKLKKDSEQKEAALHDGFIEILGDRVIILAESCEWPEEIDINRAEEARIRAERRLKSAEAEINETRAEMALRRALIRKELAENYRR